MVFELLENEMVQKWSVFRRNFCSGSGFVSISFKSTY